MHFLNTIAVSLAALSATASALPLLKTRQVTDASNPVDDLLTNVEGGLTGFTNFLGGSGGEDKKKREVVGDDASNPVDDLVTNVEGGLSGFADFVGGGE